MTRFTARTRRGIPALLKYLMEDVDHALDSPQHPMYRRLKASQRMELAQLISWLREQAEPSLNTDVESQQPTPTDY